MIGRLILLIAFVIAVATLIGMVKNTPKTQLKALYWKVGLSTIAALLLLMVVTGRVHWIGAIIAVTLPFIRQAIPLLIRYFPLLQQVNRQRQAANPDPSSGNSSDVSTQYLHMTMDHDTNRLNGEVIEGPYKGEKLDELPLEILMELLVFCQQQDHDSKKLLVSYLNHRFGNSWQHKKPAQDSDGPMTTKEAYSILGLKPKASKEEIVAAHRKLMQKVHPDRGGNDYLAAKINLAKDKLIG
jgi:hypothetical protein